MQIADPNVILSLRGLRKSYGDVVAVKDLSLDVRRGEILGRQRLKYVLDSCLFELAF